MGTGILGILPHVLGVSQGPNKQPLQGRLGI